MKKQTAKQPITEAIAAIEQLQNALPAIAEFIKIVLKHPHEA